MVFLHGKFKVEGESWIFKAINFLFRFMSTKVASSQPETSSIGRNKSLSDLPDAVLLHLATFLSGKDVIHLSHVNQVRGLLFFAISVG